MSPRRAAIFALLILLPALGQTGARGDEQVLNGIAAVVNSDVITYTEVQEVVGTREKSLMDTYKGQDLTDKVKELRLAAVQLLIDNKLILQEFNKNKFSIPDYIVDQRVQAQIKEQFGGDRAAFIRTLAAQGMTVQKFREMVKDDIIVTAMRQKSVEVNTIVSPQKIHEYYEKNIASYSQPEQVHLRMIVLKETGQPGKQMAEELRQKYLGGADFGKLAEMYSEDSATAAADGDWGWIDNRTLNDTLTKIAFSLKPGEVSDVVSLAGSYYLLYVQEKKPEVIQPLTSVHDDIENKLMEQERQDAEQKWIAGLRKKAYIWIDGITNNDGQVTQNASASTRSAESASADATH
jgi:peptidyl-prolyl cis-trans isomerase SurA